MTLLHIDSSARRNSVSRQLTQRFVESWKREHPGGQVIERDLTTTSLPLITDEWTLAAHSDPASLTPAQRETLSVSDTLGRGIAGSGHNRNRRAHVQPYSFRSVKSLDRSDRPRRAHGPLRRWRHGRRSEGEEAGSPHFAWRRLPPRYSHRAIRPPGALPAPHSGLHRVDRCDVHSCRESKARRSRRASPGRGI